MKKRFLSIALVLCMLLSIVPLTPVVATAASTTDETLLTDTVISSLNKDDYKYYNTTTECYVLNGGTYYLGEDVTIGAPLIIKGTSTNPTTLNLNGKVLKKTGSGSVIIVNDGAYFTLTDSNTTSKNYTYTVGSDSKWTLVDSGTTNANTITLTGGVITGGTGINAGSYTFGGGVFVGSDATFNMTGGNIVGCTASHDGGGVYIAGSSSGSAAFTMAGGSIVGCTTTDNGNGGGGVFVGRNTAFTMTGGSIENCTTMKDGGGVSTDGTFTMESGTIENCTASHDGGGVFVGRNTAFTMTGGSIEGCTATNGGGVYVREYAEFTMGDARIANCTANSAGGGVYNQKTFTMSGGSIKNCTVTAPNDGGGVYTTSGTFTMQGGTIENCSANYGGGVLVNDRNGVFIMRGNSAITGCTAASRGCGVHVYKGIFTMESGTITANGNAVSIYGSGEATATMDAQGGSVHGYVFIRNDKCTLKNTSGDSSTIVYGEIDKGSSGKGKIEGKLVKFMNGDVTYAKTVAKDGDGKISEPAVTLQANKHVAWSFAKADGSTGTWDFGKSYSANAGENAGDVTLNAKWHTLTEVYAKAATCTEAGISTECWYCETCNKYFMDNKGTEVATDVTTAIDSNNHAGTLGEWQKDENSHWKTYSCCTTVKGAEGTHNFGMNDKCECGAVQYTVTFDPNGGTVDPTSATTDVEGKMTELPTPTRSGSYRFNGWFTEKNGGTAVTVDTIYEAHTTVYAHWTYTGSTTPDYCVIKATAGEGGSITPSGRAAVLYGASKTFTITPNDGYAIADVKVDGKSVGAVKTYTFERVRGDHTIEAIFMKATGNPQTGVDVPFTDVSENDWFYEDVAYVYANDLMKGTSETTFSPAVTTTRGMIVTILYRLDGEPTVSGSCPFDDVKSGSYYEKAIIWAAANEIVGGYGNGKFGPDDAITREQMAVILYRYTQYKGMDVSVGEDTNILSYNDAQEISEYAFSAMQWACGESILNGSDGNLMPQGNATRAQVAAILHRFCENILK